MALSLPTVSISLRMDSLDLVYGVSRVAVLSYLQVEKDIALLDMLEIGGYGTDNFTLRFRDKKDQPTISVSTGSASNLIQVIRAAYGAHERVASLRGLTSFIATARLQLGSPQTLDFKLAFPRRISSRSSL